MTLISRLADLQGPDRDGGLAFPNSAQPDFQYAEAGMSLRDYFAGQVIGSLSAFEGSYAYQDDGPLRIATQAYRIADAMLAARASPQEKRGLRDGSL